MKNKDDLPQGFEHPVDGAFKDYDIRGVLSDDFVRSISLKVALKYGDVVVLSDPKLSSKHFLGVFSRGIVDAGRNVIDCGVGPTDMCSVACSNFNVVGIMFTASHLSEGQDGIKFHLPNGLPFSKEMISDLKDIPESSLNDGGSVRRVNFLDDYVKRIVSRYHELFSYDLRGLEILVDLKNGSGVSPIILRKLGASVKVVNSEGSDPSKGVSYSDGFDLVLAHDFDADRVVVLNENGIIHGSVIACILSSILKGKIVASIDSSSVISGFAPVIYERVGDPFIARAVVSNGAVLGVEPSGHYTDPLFALSSSGSLFAVIIAGIVKRKSLSDWLSELPKVNIEMGSLRVDDRSSFMNVIYDNVKSVISRVDGVKFEFRGGTALVRPSGTESLIRFQLEGSSSSVNDLMGFFTKKGGKKK